MYNTLIYYIDVKIARESFFRATKRAIIIMLIAGNAIVLHASVCICAFFNHKNIHIDNNKSSIYPLSTCVGF